MLALLSASSSATVVGTKFVVSIDFVVSIGLVVVSTYVVLVVVIDSAKILSQNGFLQYVASLVLSRIQS